MPFKEVNIKNYIDEQKAQDPDFKEAWDEFTISLNSLLDMDEAVENFRQGVVSGPVDMSDF